MKPLGWLHHPFFLLLVCGLILLGLQRSFSPPEPLAANVPDTQFSAARAFTILEDLLQENRPHVVGSALNGVVGDRVINYFERYGYTVETQSLFHCMNLFSVCADVRNVLVRIHGTAASSESGPRSALLLTAHYDSAWSGAGAGDDGAGTAAILEIARMLAQTEPVANDIILLISDGEEQGLVGADAFAQHHPWFDDVDAVINLEARGVTGPSSMFETGDGNRSIIRIFSKAVQRPVANSLTYEVYKRMPNDTDYSVYRARGEMGLNFAFTGGVANYHSAIDDVDHLDQGSLQHHGDNAWALIQALGHRDLTRITSDEDAGYTDLFAWRLLHYPASVTGGLALVLGVLALLMVAIVFRRQLALGSIAWAALATVVLLSLLLLGSWLLSWPLGRWPQIHPLEHPSPWAGRMALLALASLVSYAVSLWIRKRQTLAASVTVSWVLVAALGIWLANNIPTAAHLALLPLAAFVLGGCVDMFRRRRHPGMLFAMLFGFAASAYLSLYHFQMLDVILNFDQAMLKAATLSLMLLTLLPLLQAQHERSEPCPRALTVLAAVLVVCTLVQALMPAFTPDRPRPMALLYQETDSADQASLRLSGFRGLHDEEFADQHGFEIPTGQAAPQIQTPRRGLPEIRMVKYASQRATDEESSLQRHYLSLQLPPAMRQLNIGWADGLRPENIRFDGQLTLDRSRVGKMPRNINRLRVVNPAAGVVELSFDLPEDADTTLTATATYDLPPDWAPDLLAAWPENAQANFGGHRAVKVQTIQTGSFSP